jgi:two-component system LytT family response regulator
MEKLKAIIVDDEKMGIKALAKLIELYTEGLEVMGEATNISDALDLIRVYKPDVVFLDIELQGERGFDLLDKLENVTFEVVFVTAYEEYAIKAIRYSALEYLLKPVNINELRIAINKLQERSNKEGLQRYTFLKEQINDVNPFTKIILPSRDRYVFLRIEDIIYLEGEGNYTYFYHDKDEKTLVSKPIKEYEDLLERKGFFRIHKTFFINLSQIDKVMRIDGLSVIMSNGVELPVALRKKDEFIEQMARLG